MKLPLKIITEQCVNHVSEPCKNPYKFLLEPMKQYYHDGSDDDTMMRSASALHTPVSTTEAFLES